MGFTSIFFAVMGLFFFLPPLGVIAYKLYFRLGCRKAYGQVIRIEKVRDEETDSMMLKVLISFLDEDGRKTEIRNGIQYGLRYMPAVNSTVKVYYRPGTQPLKFQVASRGLWQVSAFLMLPGFLLMLPALLYFLLAP